MLALLFFTYTTPTGDYDKIWRPSLQDGVGRLTRFSPWDDHAHLPSSTSGPSNTHDRTAEPLASPGWVLTADSCILMSCCQTTVGSA